MMKKYLIYSIFFALLSRSVAQTGILNNFNTNSASGLYTATPGSYTLTVINNELRVVANKNSFQNFEFNFNAINIQNNPILTLKVRTTNPFNLRIDLKDSNGRTTNANPITINIPASNNYQTYTFNFSGRFNQSYPVMATVNSNLITGIIFLFNPGTNYNGTVFLDDIQLGDPIPFVPGKILVNQLGYELNGPKKAIYQLDVPNVPADSFYLINNTTQQIVLRKKLNPFKNVPGWQNRYFIVLDFSEYKIPGMYKIKIGNNFSYQFKIEFNLIFNETAQKIIQFFNGMRNTMASDNNLSFFGPRNDFVNVYGGWSDATGDPGKHMSHLSYANFFNPQQIPFVCWSLLKSYEVFPNGFQSFDNAVKSEITWGIDYLVRNVDPLGYLYLSIFDDWGDNPASREITEWGQAPNCDKCRSANYQAAMREGAGLAIASLARAHYMNIQGIFTNQYLNKAITLYTHLKQAGNGYPTKNLEYCNNHEENLLDYYCGLLASTELYKATNSSVYLADAQNYTDLILSLQHSDGWLYADNAKTRPFYHAADEGLPILALAEFSTISNYKKSEIENFLTKWFNWYKMISTEIENPFLYVRQYGRPYINGNLSSARKAFFIPQQNETGYWWQGENARIASMATAFWIIYRFNGQVYDVDTTFKTSFSIAQLDWILGKNPFDVCMMTGVGSTTYPSYLNGQKGFNLIGGICNGITSKSENETDIDWMPFDQNSGDAWRNWRWIEQWLPHDAWFLLAVTYLAKYNYESSVLSNKKDTHFKKVEFFNDHRIKIFPNPCTNSKLFMQYMFNEEIKPFHIQILNTEGKCIQAKYCEIGLTPYEMNLENLEKGFYIIIIEDLLTGNKHSCKLFVQ